MLNYLSIMLNARLAKMDERGASAVEYGLLIAGIAALIVVVVFAFGSVIKAFSRTPARASRPAVGEPTPLAATEQTRRARPDPYQVRHGLPADLRARRGPAEPHRS